MIWSNMVNASQSMHIGCTLVNTQYALTMDNGSHAHKLAHWSCNFFSTLCESWVIFYHLHKLLSPPKVLQHLHDFTVSYILPSELCCAWSREKAKRPSACIRCSLLYFLLQTTLFLGERCLIRKNWCGKPRKKLFVKKVKYVPITFGGNNR